MIRDLCFAGPFAERYRSHFPTFQGADGKVAREVPVVMVALVATVKAPSCLKVRLARFVLRRVLIEKSLENTKDS